MGGAGTLFPGSKYPGYWAAIDGIAPAAFLMQQNRAEILAPLKGKVPVIIIPGAKDTAVAAANTRQWIKTMKELKPGYKYVEIPGGDHGSVITTGMPDVFEFFKELVKSAN
jgi:alpha-beta hydrolase superfamily lysophospholipase